MAVLAMVLAMHGVDAEARFSGYNEDYTVPRAAEIAAEGRARFGRFNVLWDEAEPRRGRYDWSRVDAQIQSMRRAGLIPVPIVYRTPPWASPDGSVDRPPRPDARGDYARFIRALVERFHPRYVGVWNEPNHRAWWGEWPVESYERLFRRVRRELAGLDVELFAGNTAPLPGWQAYLRAFVRDVGGPYLLAQHIYPRTLKGAVRDMASQWRTAHRIGAGRDLWVTELGILSTTVGEERQARALANACRAIKSPVLVYSLLDHPNTFEWFAGYGVLRDDFSPKPAYYALRATLRD